MGRNKYILLVLIGVAISFVGQKRAHRLAVTARVKAAHSAHIPEYKDAVIAHRFHQNHFKRHRFNLDGILPVQQDAVVSTVTGNEVVALVQNQRFPTPAKPSLRGPPAA